MRPLPLVILSVVWTSCAGVTAERPLTIPLGIERKQVDTVLAQHKYCHGVERARGNVETYPRCKRAGAEWGESWVTGKYDNAGRLAEVRRYKRFPDDARATERCNQLVTD